jgi:hypothetical protein
VPAASVNNCNMNTSVVTHGPPSPQPPPPPPPPPHTHTHIHSHSHALGARYAYLGCEHPQVQHQRLPAPTSFLPCCCCCCCCCGRLRLWWRQQASTHAGRQLQQLVLAHDRYSPCCCRPCLQHQQVHQPPLVLFTGRQLLQLQGQLLLLAEVELPAVTKWLYRWLYRLYRRVPSGCRQPS